MAVMVVVMVDLSDCNMDSNKLVATKKGCLEKRPSHINEYYFCLAIVFLIEQIFMYEFSVSIVIVL